MSMTGPRIGKWLRSTSDRLLSQFSKKNLYSGGVHTRVWWSAQNPPRSFRARSSPHSLFSLSPHFPTDLGATSAETQRGVGNKQFGNGCTQIFEPPTSGTQTMIKQLSESHAAII